MIPEGHILAPAHSLWLEAVQYVVEAAGRRADWTRNALRFAWLLMKRSTWAMLTAPMKGATWAHLAVDLGVSRRTIANLVRWFIEHGVLAHAVPGTTVRFRPGTMCGLEDDGRGNEAAQYLLTIPLALLDADDDVVPVLAATVAPADGDEVPWPCETLPMRPLLTLVPDVSADQSLVDGKCTPQPSPTPVGEEPPRTARAQKMSESSALSRTWPATVTPDTKRDRLRACERLISELPVLGRISARHLRSVLRPAFDLGATIADIRHALDRRPDGSPWIHTEAPRWVSGWVRHRLSAWITDDDQLVALWPSQQRAVAAREQRDRQAAMREQRRLANLKRAGGPLPDVEPLSAEEYAPPAPLPDEPCGPNAAFRAARAAHRAQREAEEAARLGSMALILARARAHRARRNTKIESTM